MPNYIKKTINVEDPGVFKIICFKMLFLKKYSLASQSITKYTLDSSIIYNSTQPSMSHVPLTILSPVYWMPMVLNN